VAVATIAQTRIRFENRCLRQADDVAQAADEGEVKR
jgi:hypothetical protein